MSDHQPMSSDDIARHLCVHITSLEEWIAILRSEVEVSKLASLCEIANYLDMICHQVTCLSAIIVGNGVKETPGRNPFSYH